MAPSAVSSAQEPVEVHEDKLDIFTKKGGDRANFAVGAGSGGTTIPKLPVFASKEEERQYSKERLACAFRVFAANGFDEGLSGHMSLRDPVNPRTFWINP